MKTPVKKRLYVNEPLASKFVFKTNINALAFYSNLNDDNQNYYAIHHTDFLNLKKKEKIKTFSEYFDEYVVEVWRYKPGILTNNNFVDPLSLYLSFEDTQDERIEMALEQIIEKFIW